MSDTDLPKVNINYDDNDEIDNTYEQVENKYTKIDNLDEDDIIPSQRYVCLSFISPEGVMNTNIRSVKVRGVFETQEEANSHCDKLQKQDKYFDVFVGECGKWLPWNPDPHSVKDIKYTNKKLAEVMDTQKESEMKKLNELAGRHKELIDKGKKDHERRKADKIVTGNQEDGGITIENENPTTIKPKKKSVNSTRQDKLEQIRKRMKNKLELRKNDSIDLSTNNLEQQIKVQQNKIKEKEDSLNDQQQSINTIENNINKMKEYINK